MQKSKEDYKKALRCRTEIIGERITQYGLGIEGFWRYTGVFNQLGVSTFENTPLAANQMEFALSLSEHPLIESIIRDERITPETFSAEPLVEAKVFFGMKMLDLGCGSIPSFARCARALGAEVFTVDIVVAEEFKYSRKFPEDQRRIEMQNHIPLDLREHGAEEIIMKRTGGEFDLVTEAHLITGSYYGAFYGGQEIALRLLKKKGVHFNANYRSIFVKVE